MLILHVTNIVSHHQLPLGRRFVALVGEDHYRFAATLQPDAGRKMLGWESAEKDPWILRAGESREDRAELERWWDKADAVICGERRLRRMRERLDRGRLTFYMSERWWKPPLGIARMMHPRFTVMAADFLKLAKSPSFHYLPAGTYAAGDMRRIAAFNGRMWQWGYFTDVADLPPLSDSDDGTMRILWAGRMLAWKNVDALIRALARVQSSGRKAVLTLVGDGPERIRLERLANKWLRAGSFWFRPSLPTAQVIELMKRHQVYVLPSNGTEGWGVVLNEAMSVGCAVIASDAAGAAKAMIRHEENGLLFRSGRWPELAERLLLLADDEPLRRRLGAEGQRTVADCWSPSIAAERFIAVCSSLLAGRPAPAFSEGPMAPCFPK